LHHQQPPLTTTQSPLETEEYTEKQKQKEEGKAVTEERKGSDRGKKYIPEKKNNHSCHRASSPPPQHTT
jgi:hypothetical protein